MGFVKLDKLNRDSRSSPADPFVHDDSTLFPFDERGDTIEFSICVALERLAETYVPLAAQANVGADERAALVGEDGFVFSAASAPAAWFEQPADAVAAEMSRGSGTPAFHRPVDLMVSARGEPPKVAAPDIADTRGAEQDHAFLIG